MNVLLMMFVCIKVARGSTNTTTSTAKYIEAFNNPYVKILLACKICSKEMPIKYPGNWKQHFLSHASSSEKPFKCQYCEKSFIRGDRLKNHVTKHHPGVEQSQTLNSLSVKKEPFKQESQEMPTVPSVPTLPFKMEGGNFQWNTIVNNQ